MTKTKVGVQAAVLTGILASNLPDLDFLFQIFDSKDRTGYLLQHRGYTHTLLLSIPIGFASAWLGKKLARQKGPVPLWLFFLGWVGVVLHVAADFGNNYGVHPFSPFLNRWYYGDFIFILEPLLWLCLIPLAFWTATSNVTKSIWALLEAALLTIVWTRIFTPWPVALALTVWGLGFLIIQRKFQKGWQHVVPAYVGLALVYLTFGISGYLVRQSVSSSLMEAHPDGHVHTLATTPAPGNPLCWSVNSLSQTGDGNYSARTGLYSLAPGIFQPEKCFPLRFMTSSKPLVPVGGTVRNDRLVWLGEFIRPRKELVDLQAQFCLLRNWLKFARIPIWFKDGENWIAEDLRYRSAGRSNFSHLLLNADTDRNCKDSPLPWIPPTAAL